MVEAHAIELESSNAASADWDSFAVRCGASHRGLSGFIDLKRLSGPIISRTVRYSILHQQAGVRTKIGQCAIGVGPRRRIFAEGLQLLPEYQKIWGVCMQAVVNKLGSGRYIYGSSWSLEPPREGILSSLKGIAVNNVDKYMVEGVDFARWGSWDEYSRSISSNVRRNVDKARRKYEDFQIEVKQGFESFVLNYYLLHCRAKMIRRKSGLLAAIGRTAAACSTHSMRSIYLPRHAFSAVLRSGDHVPAAFGGAEVGQQTYYFEGGSMDTDGAGWLLKMSLMQDFYIRHPTGRFIMGHVPRREDQTIKWESPDRGRRDVRVSGFPTSVVTFTVT